MTTRITIRKRARAAPTVQGREPDYFPSLSEFLALESVVDAGLADGDKGDITVSAGASVWTIDNGAVTTSKLGGDITAAGKALLDDADNVAQRTTLGLGTLATQSGTFSGSSSGTNTGDNATNTQYSGLATSKQDTLISNTNIKTVNGASLLGPGEITIAGTVNISQTEIDFGSTPLAEQTFTIIDAGVSGTSQIIAQVAWEAPTGKDEDEIEMDDLQIRCKPGVGQFDMFIRAADGSYLSDKFKINYLVG